mmetsp:Transcript_4913/g.14880  ORF Transcript_4913/g.14880 Transcript_4913/m.14880 type:complete len:363 (-) Transcript_4913:237-1325(-)
MELVFLGTSAGSPTVRRNVQSVVVRLESGASVLVDCGEGTQHQLLRANGERLLRASSIVSVYLTHLHGDHSFGLPGVLCFLDASAPQGPPLRVYGPPGTRAMARAALSLSRTELKRGYAVTELVGGPDDVPLEWEPPGPHPNELPGDELAPEAGLWSLADDAGCRVLAASIDHAGIPCLAYCLQEPPRPAKIRADVVTARAREAGVDAKRLFAEIRRTGRTEDLSPADIFVGGRPDLPGRRVVVFGDCRPNHERRDAVLRLAADADVVVHEATLDVDLADLAHARGHSTPRDAGRLARDARARLLVLWHFSPRYDRADADDLETRFRDAAAADGPFPGTVLLASDFLKLPVPLRSDPAVSRD